MRVARLWLTDFRNYHSAETDLAPGLTVVTGSNGEGKTSLLEGIGYLATLSSFRSVPNDALVRSGATHAVVRAEGERDGRDLVVEAEIATKGRGRVLVNHQSLRVLAGRLGAGERRASRAPPLPGRRAGRAAPEARRTPF